MDFAKLHQAAGRRANARIQCQAVAFNTFQLKTDPVVLRPPSGRRIIGIAYKILNHSLEPAVVEEIANGHSAANLRNLDRRPRLFADVFESAVALIHEKEFRLKVA